MADNIIKAIHQECDRARELLVGYREIGPAGVFGSMTIQATIEEGEAAIEGGDVTRMVCALSALQGNG